MVLLDYRLVESNCEVAALQSENEGLRQEMAQLGATLADAERRITCLIQLPVVQSGSNTEGMEGSRLSPRARRLLTWNVFTERHDKFVRALKRSFTTEALLLKSCRGVKDELVFKSAQLRAALHQKAIDNETITNFRQQAERCALKAEASAESEWVTVTAPRHRPLRPALGGPVAFAYFASISLW